MWQNRNNAFKTYASLRIYGRELVPEIVTKSLGIQPTKVSVGREQTVWLFSTEDQVDNLERLEAHLMYIAARLLARKRQLRALQRRFTTDVSCYFASQSDTGAFQLSRDTIATLGDLRLGFYLDGYFTCK
jgi:hypothetical protein